MVKEVFRSQSSLLAKSIWEGCAEASSEGVCGLGEAGGVLAGVGVSCAKTFRIKRSDKKISKSPLFSKNFFIKRYSEEVDF